MAVATSKRPYLKYGNNEWLIDEPDALPFNGHVRPVSVPHLDGQTRTSP